MNCYALCKIDKHQESIIELKKLEQRLKLSNFNNDKVKNFKLKVMLTKIEIYHESFVSRDKLLKRVNKT